MLWTSNAGGRTSMTGTQTSTLPHFLAMKMLLTLNAGGRTSIIKWMFGFALHCSDPYDILSRTSCSTLIPLWAAMLPHFLAMKMILTLNAAQTWL
jgi:hypothetical protein